MTRAEAPNLDRFRTAQDQPHAGFADALAEMQAGRKQSHWIWYVFPQLAGLGRSSTARHYGLNGIAEAVEYFEDPVLGSRLLAITEAVEQHLRPGDATPLGDLMGSGIDALKLVSSLTLFQGIAQRVVTKTEDRGRRLARAADAILAAAAAQGYPRCEYTLGRLAEWTPTGDSRS